MDNENKAKSLSYYHCTRGTCNGKECQGCEYAKADDAVIAMAEWKDQEFAKQKQALIDKVCKILEIRLVGGCMSEGCFDYFITKFRTAMEGE